VTRRWRCAFVALSLLVLSASFAAAAGPPAKKITLTGRGYSGPVTMTIATPAGYTSGAGGAWTGPRWKKPSAEGDSSLTVNVGGVPTAGSAEQAARKTLGSYVASWTVVSSGPIAVPHVVGVHKVGTFKGFFLILHHPDKGYEGWYKAAVGVPIGKGSEILAAEFGTTSPSDDAIETIEGTTPSVWNRKAVDQALKGVAIDGNLAARTIQAQVRPTPAEPCCGARVTGRVTDALGHPLVGVKVTLRKQSAEPCCGATTGATGAYVLKVPKSAGKGAFVLSVAAAGGTALTKSIQIG
jgi:hypothetical protein